MPNALSFRNPVGAHGTILGSKEGLQENYDAVDEDDCYVSVLLLSVTVALYKNKVFPVEKYYKVLLLQYCEIREHISA